MKQGKRTKKVPKNNSSPAQTPESIPKNIELSLQLLSQKRIGGIVNLKGIGFQMLYAVHILLAKLDSDEKYVILEGIEDIDYTSDENEFIQIKTSQRQIDASAFWSMNVLQNFFEAFLIDKSCRFRIVHNTTLAQGHLSAIGNPNISNETLSFWKNKLSEKYPTISEDFLREVFSKIIIEKTTEQSLLNAINKTLITHHHINNGTESTFLRGLFYSAFEWSKTKTKIHQQDIVLLIQNIKDSHSKLPTNLAIQNSWISAVSYNPTVDMGYYDGKAARPGDIANGMPVRRLQWEKQIENSLRSADVTIIKSSSGQGKSRA